MYVFGNDRLIRGCFTTVNIDTQQGRGAYLLLGNGNALPEGNDTDPMVVTGMNFVEKEKVHLVQCFNNTNHTYAFGLDPNGTNIQIVYTGFLISRQGTGSSELIATITGAFSDNRVSSNQEYCHVVIGSTMLNGFLVGMGSYTADSQYNLQSFVMDLQVVEVLGGSGES